MNSDNGVKNVSSDTQALVQSAPLLARLTKKRDLARVASAIAITEIRLAPIIYGGAIAGQQQADTQSYRLLLNDAKGSLRSGDIDSAWVSVQALDREMLPHLPAEELKARWISARIEAEDSKVAGWRAKVASTLDKSVDDDRDKSIAVLRETLFQIHAASQNTYNINNRLRSQITWSALSVTILVLATVVLNGMGFFDPLGSKIQQTLPLAVFSGLLGGVLSVAYTVARADSKRKIPEVRANFAVTMVRPVIGAAIALPVMFFLESGLIIAEAHLWVVLSLCFVGGFSERWFLGIVEKIENNT